MSEVNTRIKPGIKIRNSCRKMEIQLMEKVENCEEGITADKEFIYCNLLIEYLTKSFQCIDESLIRKKRMDTKTEKLQKVSENSVTKLVNEVELKKHNVSAVVRVCEPSYKTDDLTSLGIEVIDLVYDDGTFPPVEVVDEWFKLLKKQFQENPEACVAVHCVSGLGRAPVLVALALIELGLKYEDAVELIREKRRGAINAKQLGYLEKYRPKSRLKLKNGHKNSCCVQ
ncbi:hypothetical protein FQA39_LY04833 [Lamprigera yunnana]|nr:hypothetical protein FQA39_LY04833 [Lamprigera yunnana]